MSTVAWDKVRPLGQTVKSYRHIHDHSGRTVCGFQIPPAPVATVVYHDDQIPEDRADCRTCQALAPTTVGEPEAVR